MANNRMVLICNVCVPPKKEWKYGDKGVLPISKWYPGSSYSQVNCENINFFLEEHNHPELASENYSEGAGQENPVRLEYESVGLPTF